MSFECSEQGASPDSRLPGVLLLTGATGLLGSAVLRRLTDRGAPVRCLVRDPRRLGEDRVRVQLAIGDLADPASFRNALRGVDTVVHLAGSARDQPRGSIEEIDGLAVWRLARAAERAGVRRLLWAVPLGATPHHPSRVHRAKALAAEALAGADLELTTLACSLVYGPGDRRLARLDRLALLPAVPLAGRGRARVQPIWAADVADCALAALDRPPGRFELAGPEILTERQVVELALRAHGRRRRLLPVPLAALRPLLRAHAALAGPAALVTWEEILQLAVPMVTARGTADAEALGVRPRRMADVLGA
jgi:NADH dehydrogenase